MTYADHIFKENIKNILENGVFSENARPKYKDGKAANSKYITGAFATYDLSKGQFPITTLRRIPIKSAIKELYWIYSLNSNSLDVLENELGVTYWNDWDIGDRTIGVRYGQTVKKHDIMNRLLKGLEETHGTAETLLICGNMRILTKRMDYCRVPFKRCLTSDVRRTARFT